jgi:RNA polymerase sigma factor (sigma-70 family)
MEEKDWLDFFAAYEPLLEKWVSRFPAGVLREEAKQIARIACWRKLALYDPAKGASLSTYVFLVVRGAVINWYEQEKRWRERHCILVLRSEEEELDWESSVADPNAVCPEEDVLWQEWMEGLSELEVQCLTLHIRDGFSLRMVAERLGVSYERVKKCKQRVLDKLRRKMREDGSKI